MAADTDTEKYLADPEAYARELVREQIEQQPELSAAPEDGRTLLERGRYAVTEMPDGHWEIVRAGPLCDTCSACGCGEQQDPIMIPAMVARMVTGKQDLPGPLQKLLGRVGG